MDSEELIRRIENGCDGECLAFFDGMPEARRKTFAKAAAEAFRRARRTPVIEVQPGTFEANPAVAAATVAVCATCTFPVLERFGWQAIPDEERMVRVFADRRPNWLGRYAEFLLDQERPRWSRVRALMKAGLCGKPKHDNYVLGMLDHFQGASRYRGDERGVLGTLLEEPDLLEEAWRLFELEGGGEYSLAAHDKCKDEPIERWSHSFVQLSRRGVLPRDRLLDASLDALDRGFAQFRASWFSSFHELLEPTIDERVARTDKYLHLLGSPIPPTASFAMKAVARIDQHQPLAPRRLMEALRPVLIARAKSTARGALKLLAQAASRDRTAAGPAALAAADALLHEAPDVQAAAFSLIEQYGSPDQQELRDAVLRHLESVAASLRDRVSAWLGPAAKPGSPPLPAPDPSASGSTADLTGLRAKAARLPSEYRDLAGVDRALEALEAGRLDLSACRFDGTEIPRLDPDRAVRPIESLDELIDAAAAAIESNDDYDGIERVFDGVSRLCDERPRDFAPRTGPLRKRCRQRLGQISLLPYHTDYPPSHLLGVLLAWLTGDVGSFRSRTSRGHRGLEYTIDGESFAGHVNARSQRLVGGESLGRRALLLAERAAAGQSRPLLSAPTHLGGWIDPLVIVERMRRHPALETADDFDKALSLLRLAPDHRPDALSRLKPMRGEFVTAARYALGDARVRRVEPVWLGVAAARARSAWTNDPALPAAAAELGPDAGQAAAAHFIPGKSSAHPPVRLKLTPPLPSDVDARLLSVMLWRRGASDVVLEHSTAAAFRAERSVRPAALDAVCAAGARTLAGNLDWWEAHWENRAYLEPLVDPDVPLRPTALLLLALGLAAKEPGEAGLATDACIAAVADGRLDAEALGEQMLALWPTGHIKLARWSNTLGQAARTSPLHAEVVRAAIDRSLRGSVKQAPKDLHALLVLLQELVHETQQPVSDDARAFLAQVTGAGKAAKAARALLQYAGSASRQRVTEIMRDVAAARLSRAERWMERGTSLPEI